MTDDTMPLLELLQKRGGGDFLKELSEAVLQRLMEFEVEGVVGAGRHERSEDRTTYRNGFRDRTLETRLGTLELRIPKLRQGSYFPAFLEPRKTAERALVAVVQEAWIQGVSTRKVDDLVQAMGMSGISKSQISKLCQEIDERVGAFLGRRIEGEWPYLWLDATYLKVRDGGRVVSIAAIIATAVNQDGRREIIGLGLGPSEAATFWLGFLRDLHKRGGFVTLGLLVRTRACGSNGDEVDQLPRLPAMLECEIDLGARGAPEDLLEAEPDQVGRTGILDHAEGQGRRGD